MHIYDLFVLGVRIEGVVIAGFCQLISNLFIRGRADFQDSVGVSLAEIVNAHMLFLACADDVIGVNVKVWLVVDRDQLGSPLLNEDFSVNLDVLWH